MTHNFEEQRLQISVAAWLRGVRIEGGKEYPVTVPFPGLLWTHPANQGGDPREGHKFKRMGVRAGTPDFLFWFRLPPNNFEIAWPRFGAIELKSFNGVLSAAQNRFRSEFEAIGGKYALCKTGEQVRDALISWGLKCHNMAIDPPKISNTKQKALAFDMYKP